MWTLRAAIAAVISLWLGLPTVCVAQPSVLNPNDVTYDAGTGKFFGPDGQEIAPPPVPPFLRNRGWTHDPASGRLNDPNGGSIDPGTFYPSPDTKPNPSGTTYDPATKTFFGQEGGGDSAVQLPPYLEARGYRSDQQTGEIFDPKGDLVDPSTLFPAPTTDWRLRYDPLTGKYYSEAGTEAPAGPTDRMRARGWSYNQATGQWVDPSGNLLAPETVFSPPTDANPNDLSYDPLSGKFFDADGNLTPGALPEFMTNLGWTINPNTGTITGPTGTVVDPALMFPPPATNPDGFTYDPGSNTFSGPSTIPPTPAYLDARGAHIDPVTGEIVEANGDRKAPSTLFPAPSTDPGFLYDAQTGRFYLPNGAETPPTLPSSMTDMGWRWSPGQKKFIDPKGNAIDPSSLCDEAHPGELPKKSADADKPISSTSPRKPLTNIDKTQLAQRGLISVSPFDPSQPNVILVHGARGQRQTFYNLKNQFVGENYNVFMFMYQDSMLTPPAAGMPDSTYNNFVEPYEGELRMSVNRQRDVQQASYELADATKMLADRTGADTMYVASHSLGGVVTRYAMTPNNGGSSLADSSPGATQYKFFPIAVPFQGATALRVVPGFIEYLPAAGFYAPIADSDSPFLNGHVGSNVEIFKYETNEDGFGQSSVLTLEGQRHPAIDKDPQLQKEKTKTIVGGHSFFRFTDGARNIVKDVNAVRDAVNLARDEETPESDAVADTIEPISFAAPDSWHGPALQAGATAPTTHVVQPGENLYRIALRYGVSIDEIASANGLTDATLTFAGQKLVIPSMPDFAGPGDTPFDMSALNTPAATDGARLPTTQLEIVIVLRTPVNSTRNHEQPAPHERSRARALASTRSTRSAPLVNRAQSRAWMPPTSWRESLGLYPARAGSEAPMKLIAQDEAGGGPQLTGLFTALGGSTGDVFQAEFINDGPEPIDIGANGLVLEPLGSKAQEAARNEFARAAAGRPTTKAKVKAYCLEFVREPPAAGMVFRVAPPEVQNRFQSMRNVMRAAKRVLDAGGLTPDSDPGQYFDAILQWSIWTKENGFDVKSFGDAFIDRTKKNFEAASRPWTAEIEQLVAGLVPNRWSDIERVLKEADTIEGFVRN